MNDTTAVKVLPAFREDADVIEATAKALMERGLTVNGNTALLTDIAALAKLGLFEKVGIAEKPLTEKGSPVRGPNAGVFRINRAQFNGVIALR